MQQSVYSADSQVTKRSPYFELETYWQQLWYQHNLYKAIDFDSRPKKYILTEFPYPSGASLHIGHAFRYTVPDVYARFLRMNGYNVLFPMGWDAFGLPTEERARKEGKNPKLITQENIKNFKQQLLRMGYGFDWEREFSTTDPDYYKWTQWIFGEFYKAGLAEQKEMEVWWCPELKTVLSNEEVLDGPNGTKVSERGEHPVVRKKMRQWVLKMPVYAEKLLVGLEEAHFPEHIKEMQRNWIGKSEGCVVKWSVVGYSPTPLSGEEEVPPNSSNRGREQGEKLKVVILHGYGGNPEANFFPWLKTELEKLGYTVWLQTLPNTDNPNIDEQVEFVRQSVTFDSQTILVGHSLGGVVAMRLLERLPQPILGLVLVGSLYKPELLIAFEPSFLKQLNWQWDFDKIRQQASSIKVLSDLQDCYIPVFQGRDLASLLQAELIEYQAEGTHFMSPQEPKVLATIQQIIKHYRLNQATNSQIFIETFTTRVDTIFAVTFLVLAPEHPLVNQVTITEYQDKVQDYLAEVANKSERERQIGAEKTGVFTGSYAVNPITGELVPIWIADYVLGSYGTGAIMAVPGHDDRDYEFAQKFNLPILENVKPAHGEKVTSIFTQEGVLYNSGDYSGLTSQEAKIRLTAELEAKGQGYRQVNYKFRDWVFSRQRYWGEPFPFEYIKTGVKRVNHELYEYLESKLQEDGIGQAIVDCLIVNEQGQIYCQKRSLNQRMFPGLWVVPGRHVEKGESIEQSIRKELKEELGVEVESIPFYLGYVDWTANVEWAKSKDENLKRRSLVFVVKIVGEPQILEPEKTTEYAWFDQTNLDKLDEGRAVLASNYFPSWSENRRNQEQIKSLLDRYTSEVVARTLNFLEWDKTLINGKTRDQGHREVNHQFQDQVVSHQNYWGESSSFAHSKSESTSPEEASKTIEIDGELYQIKLLSAAELPLVLPDVEDYLPSEDGRSPLAKTEWINIRNDQGELIGKREPDTMPNWAGSSWYYLRFCDPKNDQELASYEKLKYWLPVDHYFGGSEHTTLHLLYSRFWHRFLYDLGYVSTPEPYDYRTNGGLLLGPDGRKMSKSLGNVVSPDEKLELVGADALRLYINFIGPYDGTVIWQDGGLKACKKLVDNIWALRLRVVSQTEAKKPLIVAYHKLVRNVTQQISELRTNVAVAELMTFVNLLKDQEQIPAEVWKGFLQVLAPFAPHIAEELWYLVNNFDRTDPTKSIHLSKWPEFDPDLCIEDQVIVVVQVNGKIRGEFVISKDSPDDLLINKAKEVASKWLLDRQVKFIKVIPNKMVTLAVE